MAEKKRAKNHIRKRIKKRIQKVARNKVLLKAITSFFVLTVAVIAIAYYFVFKSHLIGPAFIALGIFSLIFIRFRGIKIKNIIPDLIFGFIDNSVMVFAAIIGARVGSVPGAIIGGVSGNTITDGIGGLFEGHIADHQREYKIDNLRTALSSSIGKMIGCILGAGFSLTGVYIISNLIQILF